MKPYDYDSKKLKKVRGGIIESPPPPAYVDDRGPSRQSWISYNRPLSQTQPSLSTAESQTSKKRGGCHITCCNGNYIEISTRGGFALVAIVAIIAAVVIVALVKTLPKHVAVAAAGNSTTSTTTVVVSEGTTFTQTQAPTTVILTHTSTVSTTSTSSASTAATTIPAPIEGFVAHSWPTDDIQLFYQDPAGVQGTILSSQFLSGTWSSPAVIATDARAGTTLSLSIVYYDLDLDDTDSNYDPSTFDDDISIWRVTYVDNNGVLQSVDKQIQFDPDDQYVSVEVTNIAGGSGWTKGILGSYGFKASSTSYTQSCTWSSSVTEYGADTYLYFDSAAGTITKLGYYQVNNSWVQFHDMPTAFSGSNLAMECADLSDSIENMWVINAAGQLQQWWIQPGTDDVYYGYDDNEFTTTAWTQGVTYSGALAPNTSLASWSGYPYGSIFFQAPNGTIMSLAVSGSGSGAYITGIALVGTAQLGTRLSVTGSEAGQSEYDYVNNGVDHIYLFYQNGFKISRDIITINPSTGNASATSKGKSTSTAGVFSPLLLILCLAFSMWLLA